MIDQQVWLKAFKNAYAAEVRACSSARAMIGTFLSRHGVRKRDYTIAKAEEDAVPQSWPSRDTYRFKHHRHAVLLRLALDENGRMT